VLYMKVSMIRIPLVFMRNLISSRSVNDHPPHFIKVILTSINIMQHRIMANRLALDPPDVELNPTLNMGAFDFRKTMEAIEIGMKCVEEKIQIIKEAIEKKN